MVAEQIGAQIFIDGWAMVCPGDPERAADFARRAASVSHDGAAIHGAQIIGYGEDLGSLEPGKLADLVVLEQNPLDDIRHTNTIKLVMKNGELFDADHLNQIWPEKKPLPPLWWWEP